MPALTEAESTDHVTDQTQPQPQSQPRHFAPPSTPAPLSPAEKSRLRLLVAPLILRPGACRGFESGTLYRGVYRHKHGWRAQVKFLGTSGNSPSGTQKHLRTHREAFGAAVELARWWERRLGPRWAEILRQWGGKRGGEKDSGGSIWHDARVPWRVVREKGSGKLVAVAWVRGVRTLAPGKFACRRDAALALFNWLDARYGRQTGGPLLWFPGEGPGQVPPAGGSMGV